MFHTKMMTFVTFVCNPATNKGHSTNQGCQNSTKQRIDSDFNYSAKKVTNH